MLPWRTSPRVPFAAGDYNIVYTFIVLDSRIKAKMLNSNMTISEKHIEQLKEVLKKGWDGALDFDVFIFGSRADGDALQFSDIDLGLIGDRNLKMEEKADIEELLDESNLPYIVDLVEFNENLSDEFIEQTETNRIYLWKRK